MSWICERSALLLCNPFGADAWLRVLAFDRGYLFFLSLSFSTMWLLIKADWVYFAFGFRSSKALLYGDTWVGFAKVTLCI